MTHVSHRKLDDDHIKALYKEFLRSLERCFDDEKGFLVLNQFLTRTEREMFSKRFAVIAMLEKKVPIFVIAKVLKMSPVTIETMSVKYEAGRYEWILKAALGKKDIWEIIESIITVGGIMPPRVGGKRWKHSDKADRKTKLRNS